MIGAEVAATIGPVRSLLPSLDPDPPARFVVLGLARARSSWFGTVDVLAMTETIELVAASSSDELRVLLATGRPYSAVLVDGTLSGIDRDLVGSARAAGCAVIVVGSETLADRWGALGAAACLPHTFTAADLLEVLERHAAAVPRGVAHTDPCGDGGAAPLVAVLGMGGAGVSTVAIALAQGLALPPRTTRGTALIDGRFDADQATLHAVPRHAPGILDLVEAHAFATPALPHIRAATQPIGSRGYRLVPGLRRRRDWTALRPQAVECAIDSLRRAFGLVVADIECDLDGEDETGSFDVGDRNVVARSVCRVADVVVVVVRPDRLGPVRMHDTLRRLTVFGVPADRVVVVVNRAARGHDEPDRAGVHATAVPAATVPEISGLEVHHLEVSRMPPEIVDVVSHAVADRHLLVGSRLPAPDVPTRIVPGSLGSWRATVA